ncbi:hypothetical protein XENTR_v10022754 [Xenopus tropicalis]|nr:hypothetical protein XENTR_v10022754 [Xenopus tropicalis]
MCSLTCTFQPPTQKPASWLASELQLPATELPFSAAELQLSAVTSAWSSRVFARSGTSITDGTPHVPLVSRLQSLIRGLLLPQMSKEEPKSRASFKKKINTRSRLVRSPRSKNQGVSLFRVSANGRRIISESDDERPPLVRSNRRQSLESGFYRSRILED